MTRSLTSRRTTRSARSTICDEPGRCRGTDGKSASRRSCGSHATAVSSCCRQACARGKAPTKSVVATGIAPLLATSYEDVGAKPRCGGQPSRVTLRYDPRLCRFHAPLLFRMRCAQVRKLLQGVGVGLEARGRSLVFRQEGDAVVDHVVGEDPAVGILCELRRIEAQHVGKRALLVDRGNRFLARVIAYAPSDARTDPDQSVNH